MVTTQFYKTIANLLKMFKKVGNMTPCWFVASNETGDKCENFTVNTQTSNDNRVLINYKTTIDIALAVNLSFIIG